MVDGTCADLWFGGTSCMSPSQKTYHGCDGALKLITCLGETHARLSKVEDGVVAPDEDVAEDPQLASARRQVDAHEAGEADRLAHGAYVEDVVLAAKSVRLSGDDERDFR